MGTKKEMSHGCPFAANSLHLHFSTQFLSPPAAGRSYTLLSPPKTSGQLDLHLHAPPKGRARLAALLKVSPDAWMYWRSRFGTFHPKPVPPGENSQKSTPTSLSCRQTSPFWSLPCVGQAQGQTWEGLWSSHNLLLLIKFSETLGFVKFGLPNDITLLTVVSQSKGHHQESRDNFLPIDKVIFQDFIPEIQVDEKFLSV